MSDFKKYFPILVEWEGSAFENVAGDNGGPTKYGIILSEWIAKGYDKNGDGIVDVNDLKLITANDAMSIAKSHYWDRCKADDIENQSIANMLVDFSYNCGVGLAIMKIQQCVGVIADGVIGDKTITAINTEPQETLFNNLKAVRLKYYQDIVHNHPKQIKFLKGWNNRTQSFTFSK